MTEIRRNRRFDPNVRLSLMRHRALACVVGLVLPLLFGACSEGSEEPPGTSGPSDTSEVALDGEALFGETCAACHGEDLKGTDAGPPFLSPIYAPDHHPDEAFYSAVENGVQPHHWEFGPMPPQPTVSRDEVAAIIAYVREQQQAAGITEDPDH